jgi:hypothetical protein
VLQEEGVEPEPLRLASGAAHIISSDFRAPAYEERIVMLGKSLWNGGAYEDAC